MPFHYPAIQNNDPGHRYYNGNVLGSRWAEHTSGIYFPGHVEGGQYWREIGLVVATFN